jgi:hypothetical protein
MTNTYNTLNPLGSTSPKDLYDNASNFDEAMNSPSPAFWDRFLKRRETWAGMEQAFSDFLVASGFEFIGDYDADGPLTITRANQVFTKSGEYWSAGPSLVLPYTTVNNWVVDQPKFVSRGDSIIRQDLASSTPTKGVSLVSGAARYITNAAVLRTLPKTGSPFAVSQSYYLGGAMGGATYFLDLSDTTSADNGFDVWVNPGDGARWKLSLQGPAYASQAGAKLDGITDDTTVIQFALNRTNNVIIDHTSQGCVLNSLQVTSGQVLRGEHGVLTGAELPVYGGQITTIKLAAGSACAIKIASFVIGTFTKVEQFRFDGIASSGTAIRMSTATGVVYGVRLFGLSFMNCVEIIGDEASASNYVVDVEIEQVISILTRGRQIYFRRSSGFLLLKSVQVGHTSNVGDVTWETIRLDNVAGAELDRVDVVGYGTGTTYQPTAFGIVITGSGGYAASVWLKRVLCDTLHGPGIRIEGIYNVQLDTVSAGLCWGDGINLISCSYIQGVNWFVYGANLVAGRPNGAHGIVFNNCTTGVISNVNVRDCTDAAIVRESSFHIKIHGANLFSNTGWGVLDAGSSNSNMISGMTSALNTAGSLSQIGAQSAVVNWIANTGSFVASTIGTVNVA